ncbi:MAG: preprotein translocase subunit SecY [Erysipelothrix sp.]|nr:preprotein translocase subunit SecY [Erysipelothrix sp.]
MIRFIKDLFNNKEIRNRILFTLAILFLFRLGSAIPAPGIDSVKLTASLGEGNAILNIMNMLGGGSLQRFSIFSLGVGPYITASIIVQLMAMDVIPALAEMAKSGEEGRKQMDKITRYIAVVMSFVQALIMVKMYSDQYQVVSNPSWATFIYIATVLTAGTMFLCWLGDRISLKGVGNGMSMLIFAGIVSNLPSQFTQVYKGLISSGKSQGLLLFGLFLLSYILIIVLVVFTTNAERKIPIQYTSSGLGRGQSDMTYIPLKINSASVTPVIFASAIMAAPLTIASFFKANAFTKFMNVWFNQSTWQGLIVYLVLIVLFTFFYTNLQVDPEKMTENLKKNGSYIVGVRPGKDTERYVSTILNRITVLGAISLLIVAAIPPVITLLIPDMPAAAALGGTGIIIVVGVALETVSDLKGRLTQRKYSGFVRGK